MTESEQVDPQPADDHGEVVCALLGASGDEAAAKLGARLADQLSLRLALVRVEYLTVPPDAVALQGSQPMAPLAPITPVALAREPVVAPEPAKPEPWEHELVTSQPPRHDAVPGPPGEALRALSEAPDTERTVDGALVLFALPEQFGRNRPLALEVTAADGARERVILDL